jgi:protein-S-isoprenylcysteine O-methyltransferase Ste14
MKTYRLILGYLVGFSIFAVLVPFLLVGGARSDAPWLSLHLGIALPFRLVIVVPLFCLGLLFALWSNVSLLITGKGGPTDVFNVAISPRSEKLVVTGPYRYTRNPMVFGAICIYCAVAVLLNSLSELLLILLCIPVFLVYLKQTEEKRLLKDFGEEFVSYRSRAPMLIPFTKRKKSA